LVAARNTLREIATGEAAWRRRFAAAARAGSLLLYESDRPTRAITWEGDTRQVLGYEPAEMGGYDWWYDRVHADDRALVDATMARGLTTAQAFAMEYRLRRADGSYGTVLDQAEVETGAAGEVVRVVGTLQDITARKQGEEHRALLAAIVEASEDAVVSATLDGRFTSWNDSAERLFGYTAEEAIGAPIGLILPEDLLNERRKVVETLRRGERVEPRETIRLTKSGQRIPVSVSFGGIRDARGELVGIAATARDLSGRLLAAQQIKESAERYRALSEATREGIVFHDGDRIVETNTAFGRLFGCQPAEILGRAPWDFIAPDARADAVRMASSVAAEPYESVGLRKDGSRFPVEVCARTIAYQGRPMRVKLVRDLTAQKAAEADLRHERELLQGILDAIPVMIALYRPDTRVLQLNPAFERLTGWSNAEARAIDLMAACYPDPAYREEVRAFMASLEEGWRDVVMTTKDGRVLQTSWANIRLSDDTHVGIGIDITERKQSEEQRELLLAELSHRVKNLLAVLQALASQTSRNSASIEEFRTVFEGRLRALARAHGLLFEGRWQGADLRTLIEQTLDAHRLDRPDAIEVAGPKVTLAPKQGVALGLALHELGTNAAKYGALSTGAGRIRITWDVEDDEGARCVRLEWRELGGPKVQPPLRHGFGTTLIKRTFEHELDGSAELRFAATGLRCRASFPLKPAPREPIEDGLGEAAPASDHE
jgi:PAS domain S-box-containing protein